MYFATVDKENQYDIYSSYFTSFLKYLLFKKQLFLVCPILLPVFSYFFYNEPEPGVGINPGMALTPLPSSIGRGSNPQPSDREPSALPLDHSFRSLNGSLESNVSKYFED